MLDYDSMSLWSWVSDGCYDKQHALYKNQWGIGRDNGGIQSEFKNRAVVQYPTGPHAPGLRKCGYFKMK